MPDIGRVLPRSTPSAERGQYARATAQPDPKRGGGARYHSGAWDLDASVCRSDSDFGTRMVPINGAFMIAREKTRVEGVDVGLGHRFTRPQRAFRQSFDDPAKDFGGRKAR